MALRGAPYNWESYGSVPKGIYEESSTQLLPLGQRLVVGDRVFRYALAGGSALAAGKVMSSPAEIGDAEDLAVNTALAGDTSVTVTLGATAVVAGDYDEGYMLVIDVDSEGHTFRIKSTPAADASATLVVTLYDEIIVAFVADTTVTLIPNIYRKVVIFTASSQVGVAIGVPPIAVTAANFFWLQTWGPCAILRDENTAAYTPLVPGAVVDGALEDFDAAGSLEQIIAISGAAGVDTEYNYAKLTISQ